MIPPPRRRARRSLTPVARLIAVLLFSLGVTLLGTVLLQGRPSTEAVLAAEPTFTPLATFTPAPPSAVPPPAAPLPTATPPPDRYAGRLTASSADCTRTLVSGSLHDGLRALDGVRVRLWWPGAPADLLYSAPSGSDGRSGEFELLLDSKPRAGWWLLAPVDEAGNPLGSPLVVQTSDDGCADGTGQQLLRVEFQRGDIGLLGLAGATLTPVPTTAPDMAPATPIPTALPTPDGQERALKVPILMFHYVSVPPPDADIYRHDLSVGPDLFRAILITLRERGYTSITLEQLRQSLVAGAPLPPQPIVLTFDDGYLDNYEAAFPILQQEGFVGTFFVITDRIEQGDPAYMTWDQLREMAAAGMEIGSHSESHPDLPAIAYEKAWYELAGSRLLIEQRLGREVRSFCYPAGKFDATVLSLTEQAGYGIAVTTRQGVTLSTDRILKLPRVRVRGGQFPPELMQTIEGWMAP